MCARLQNECAAAQACCRLSFARSINSNRIMPPSIAATKPHAFGKPAPSATSAGLGHNPARPQPTPNTALPSTSFNVTLVPTQQGFLALLRKHERDRADGYRADHHECQ